MKEVEHHKLDKLYLRDVNLLIRAFKIGEINLTQFREFLKENRLRHNRGP